MADIPSSVPPRVPPTPVAAAPAPTLVEVPIRQAPPDLPATVTGTVVSSNPQTQEIRILTAQGEVVIQSAIPLPPEIEVSVEVYIDKNRFLADITILKQTIAQAKELEKIIPPSPPSLPPLREGKTVIALLLQEYAPPQAGKPATSLQPGIQAAPALPAFPGAPQKEGPAPFSAPLIGEKPAQNPFVEGSPNILRQLLTSYLPQLFGSKPDVPATPQSTAPDILDNNLLEIMRAQIHAKTSQQAIQSSPETVAHSPTTSPFPAPSGLNTLLASLETLQQKKTQEFTSPFQQLMPQAATPVPKNMYQLEIFKILPPNTPPEQIKIILQKITEAPRLSTVEATTSGGMPILKTDDNSHFVIKTPVSVPVGSTVIFRAAPAAPKQMVENMPNLMVQSFEPLLSTTWPALEETLQALPPSNQPVVQAFHNTLPTPTPQLVPTALFFLAALRLGTIDKWLGDNTLQALKQTGGKELAERLGSDFRKISSQFKKPLADDWRGISMPLLHDDQISQMQFYVRRQYDENRREKEDGAKPATRFILNLHLSRMGDMQMDGFIQKKNFDMILRTEEKLPFDMRQELMKRFAQGLEQVRMQGGISFQTRQQSWITPEIGRRKTEA